MYMYVHVCTCMYFVQCMPDLYVIVGKTDCIKLQLLLLFKYF